LSQSFLILAGSAPEISSPSVRTSPAKIAWAVGFDLDRRRFPAERLAARRYILQLQRGCPYNGIALHRPGGRCQR
jgi:hypothetical protein